MTTHWPSAPLVVVFTAGELAGLTWQDKARCAEVDPEIFFPEKGGSTLNAKRICARCEVQAECLDYALSHEDAGRYGVWGGVSERERRRIRRQDVTRQPRRAAA